MIKEVFKIAKLKRVSSYKDTETFEQEVFTKEYDSHSEAVEALRYFDKGDYQINKIYIRV